MNQNQNGFVYYTSIFLFTFLIFKTLYIKKRNLPVSLTLVLNLVLLVIGSRASKTNDWGSPPSYPETHLMISQLIASELLVPACSEQLRGGAGRAEKAITLLRLYFYKKRKLFIWHSIPEFPPCKFACWEVKLNAVPMKIIYSP